MNAAVAASTRSPGIAMGPAGRARVAQLEQVFARIGSTRMRGVPVLNPALRVQAVGFELLAAVEATEGVEGSGTPAMLEGILVTPWFMNLLRLPLEPHGGGPQPGSKRSHVLGGQRFEFIAGQEDALGAFEACSLFSPMFEFADQAGAVATAHEVLRLLRAQPDAQAMDGAAAPTPAAPLAASATPPDAAVPSRRGFLLGRMRPGATP